MENNKSLQEKQVDKLNELQARIESDLKHFAKKINVRKLSKDIEKKKKNLLKEKPSMK